MSRAHATAEMGHWNAEASPVLIEYSVPVLEQIRAEAMAGFRRFPRGGIEIGGVLFGNAEEDRVRILAARPVTCEYATGPSYVLSEKDQARFRGVLEEGRADPELSGMTPVGWYHSHTRSDIFFSPNDLEIQDRYFPSRRQIALVVRPDSAGPVRAGFFVREGNGSIRAEASYQEFALPVSSVRAPAAEPVQADGIAEPAPEPGPEPQEQDTVLPGEPELPQPEETEEAAARHRGMAWVWAALAVMVALASFTLLPRHERPAPAPRPLALRVLDSNGQLQITWDRASLRSAEVQRASIEIVDGGERVIMPFDEERLREGGVDYARRSDNVEVRLRVERTDGPQEEFVRFLGSRIDPPPAAPLPEPEEPARKAAPSAPKPQPRVFDLARLPAAQRPRHEAALPAPPVVESAGGRAVLSNLPAPPASELRVAPPPAPLAPLVRESKPKRAYAGPASGRILWTGDFRRGVAN
jgi:proteasome lid subunit RPN8/RPN11